jgi:tetratricopeptide (TPR) repeat protein
VAPELREQLQSHLGSAYTIERELGGGGMSRVFLAQEVRLRRSVVVKVLPPQMAAGVSVERFEREIQLAAKLQHPHIVPLLTAGSAGDLLYYVMPHIEGESLRARLAHDHELPVGEAVRILRDVVDALAYAHAHGIVHRDIKPDNVLLSGKHALVTDFGVAKAVSESTGKTALTSMGVALGTPAYMAPEQAAADPNTDHRADLYAVGAVAYEMLTGRPPFTGTSPQAVLAAQVTQPPEPISQQRASVPAPLAALVLRCLEKKPADRLQTADELLAQLEAMATPAAGTALTGAVPVTSSGTEAAIRRAHPGRVAALFTAASIGVIAVVYVLMRGLGLPDWVLVAAVGLLLAGLPIMVVTGLIERRRALARSTGRIESPAASGLRQWLTWRKALVGGAAAFTALGVGTAAYMAMRLLGIGPVGTLVASGVLRTREPLLLARFENRTPDSTLGPSLAEAFRVDLSQSPSVKLLGPQAVADALRRMQRAPATPLDLALARELAQRAGVKAVVTGEIDPVGQSYQLSASLVAASDGLVLTAVRETAADDRALIGAIDRLSKKLRERIGESVKSIRAAEPLEQVTTGSLPALRRYTQARQAADVGDWEGAATLYQEAAALDTGFAMAYRKLGAMLTNAQASQERVVAALTKAFALRERLPDVERSLAIAAYYDEVENDPTRAVAAYRAALERDSDNTPALNNLALELTYLRQYREAERLALHAMTVETSPQFYANAIAAQVGQGHFADAETTLVRFARVLPQTQGVFYARALLESARGNYRAAEQAAVELRNVPSSGLHNRASGTALLAALDQVRGKLSRATRDFEDFMAVSEARGLPGAYLVAGIGIAEIDRRFRNQLPAGVGRIETALGRHPLNTIPASDRPYVALSRYYAAAGRLEDARRLLSAYERVVPAGVRRGDPERRGAEGDLQLAAGRTADAIASYQAWRAESCSICGVNGIGVAGDGSFELATAYDRAHAPDSAVAYYERAVTMPAFARLFADARTLAAALKRLGELAEERGNRAAALDYYGRFVDLWKEGDPELQPVVKDVRARIARLASEH